MQMSGISRLDNSAIKIISTASTRIQQVHNMCILSENWLWPEFLFTEIVSGMKLWLCAKFSLPGCNCINFISETSLCDDVSTNIDFPKVFGWHVVVIIITFPSARGRNHPVIFAGYKCCVVVQALLPSTMLRMSPFTMVRPFRTILSQPWVIAIHTNKGVTRIWHFISFTAKKSNHFCAFVVQSRCDVECCSFFFTAVKSYLGEVCVGSKLLHSAFG